MKKPTEAEEKISSRDASEKDDDAVTADLAQWACNYDGRVREDTLKRCADLARPDLLPIAISRLNDWVPQVRAAAREAVVAILPSADASTVLSTFAAIEALRRAKREDHSAWIGRYEKAVSTIVPVSDLIAGAKTQDLIIGRTCLALLSDFRMIEPAACVALAFARSGDIKAIRRAMQMCAALSDIERMDYYRKALCSHFGAIRTMALRALLNDPATVNKADVAIAALMDSQPTVRFAAHYFLQQARFHLRSHYTGLLNKDASAEQLKIALAGLANCASQEDVAIARAFLDCPLPGVQVAAFAAWLKLAPNDKDRIAALALRNASSRVRRYGILIVQRHFAYVPQDEIIHLLSKTCDVQLLSIIASGSSFTWLTIVANTVLGESMPERMRAALARRCAEQMAWHTQFISPTREELACLLSSQTRESFTALMHECMPSFYRFYTEAEQLQATLA